MLFTNTQKILIVAPGKKKKWDTSSSQVKIHSIYYLTLGLTNRYRNANTCFPTGPYKKLTTASKHIK